VMLTFGLRVSLPMEPGDLALWNTVSCGLEVFSGIHECLNNLPPLLCLSIPGILTPEIY
jgi:hypothetical protein